MAVSCSGVAGTPGRGPSGLVGIWFIGPDSWMPLRALMASRAALWAMTRAPEPLSMSSESSSSLSLMALNLATIALPASPSISLSSVLELVRMLSATPLRRVALVLQSVAEESMDSSLALVSAACNLSR